MSTTLAGQSNPSRSKQAPATINPVVHFELPYEDRKRMAGFYAKAFGWQACMLGPEMGEYVTVATTESDETGPKRSGAINGGLYHKSPEHGAQYPTVVIAVDDIADSIQKVAAAGGKVIGQPTPIPGVGTYAAFTDTEGNRIAMLQPLPRTGGRPASR